MAENETIETASKVIVGILFVTVVLGILLYVTTLIIGTTTTINNDLNGKNFTTVTITNESGFINNSGYTLAWVVAYGFKNPVITSIYDVPNDVVVKLGNATVSASGVVKNATVMEYPNVTISYTYQYDTTSSTTTNSGFTSIQNSIIGLVVNFFSLAPTLGTIFAVIVLIAGIVILVLYVKKMKDTGSGKEAYYG